MTRAPSIRFSRADFLLSLGIPSFLPSYLTAWLPDPAPPCSPALVRVCPAGERVKAPVGQPLTRGRRRPDFARATAVAAQLRAASDSDPSY